MTRNELRAAAKLEGFTIRETDGEIRVAPKGLDSEASERAAYYTDCREDAYRTMLDMSRRMYVAADRDEANSHNI